jgi:hypothetical protein
LLRYIFATTAERLVAASRRLALPEETKNP